MVFRLPDSWSNRNLEVFVFEESGKYPEKNLSEQKKRTNNKLKPHMASTPGYEPWPHGWEASALTNAPPLLSKKPFSTFLQFTGGTQVSIYWLSELPFISVSWSERWNQRSLPTLGKFSILFSIPQAVFNNSFSILFSIPQAVFNNSKLVGY